MESFFLVNQFKNYTVTLFIHKLKITMRKNRYNQKPHKPNKMCNKTVDMSIKLKSNCNKYLAKLPT